MGAWRRRNRPLLPTPTRSEPASVHKKREKANKPKPTPREGTAAGALETRRLGEAFARSGQCHRREARQRPGQGAMVTGTAGPGLGAGRGASEAAAKGAGRWRVWRPRGQWVQA